MPRRNKRVLALGILCLTFACLQCVEKEGSISRYMETAPAQYRIEYLKVMPVSVYPGQTAQVEGRDNHESIRRRG